MSLKSILQEATKNSWATGHFNASELDQMKAIILACEEVNAPAIIGTSEGERKHLGILEAVALRDIFRSRYKIPIFLNADHCKSFESAKETIDAGYDSVHIDLSHLSFEENVAGTCKTVEYARKKNSDISIEGELGYLKGESKILKEKIEVSQKDYTNPQEALDFIKKTGVDRLAIVVGNIHGISIDEPNLDIERIKEIRHILPSDVVLTLHAGSGIPDDQISEAIKAGIANIHINTDIRVAFIKGMEEGLKNNPDETAMYKLDVGALMAMKEIVAKKLKLFGMK